MNNKILLTVTILLINIGVSFGQDNFKNGYIITFEQDTIKRMIDYRSNSANYESCVFKDGEAEITFYPNQILGFGYTDGKFFMSQIKENSFVEVLIIGKMSLFQSEEMFHLKKDTMFFNLESTVEEVIIDGKSALKETSRWRGTIAYLLSDCLENTNNLIANIGHNEQSLTRIVLKYNICSGIEFTDYKVNKVWAQFEYGATVGFTLSTIKTINLGGTYYYLDESYRSLDPSFGLLINLSSPRISDKTSLQGELHFTASKYSSYIERPIDGSKKEYYDTFIELNTLSIPLSLKYAFPEKKDYGLYIQLGTNFEYQLSANTKLLGEEVNGNIVNTYPETTAFDVKKNQLGLWGGVGLTKSYPKFQGSIAIRYFQMPALNTFRGTNQLEAKINRLSINVILFKK
jgi:hypothetical protein